MRDKVEEFLRYLKDEKGYSEHTLNAYRNDLNQFIAFWSKKKAPDVPTWTEVTKEAIIEYILDLKERSYALSTMARKIAALRSFFHYLLHQGAIEDDPTVTIETPKIPKRAPKILTREQVARLLEEPAKQGGVKALRDKAILELLYFTGMKASELVSLNVDDVDLASRTVRILKRKGKERVISLPPSALEALRQYLYKGRIHLVSSDKPSPALFMNLQGERLTRQGLWVIIKHYTETIGIKERISPSTLRHSLAVHKLQEGARLEDIKKLLGHSSAITTLIYSRFVRGG